MRETRNRVNILLLTARPFERDVAYRSISRPLVELIEKRGLPASVHVLRPPTFERLREHLRERPNYYHILHFDGHGGYGVSVDPAGSPHAFRGPQGHLLFEKGSEGHDAVPAETLATLLREHRVPAVVLNACQSAMVDQHAEDAFASVAAAMLRAGVHSVVAMAYSLYVSGAQEFLPAFYRRLFEDASAAAGVRAGRQRMLEQPDRVSARGRFPLQDWLVPVVYEQEELGFRFGARAPEEASEEQDDRQPALPLEARDTENPYGFIGRDAALLELERAMRRAPAGILIQGLGGVGKTTLARGFVQWLADTDGLGNGCFWFPFNDIRNADYVLNRMGEALFGADFATRPTDRKLEALAGALREHPFVIVWDNFESVRGIDNETALLGADDQQTLKDFLAKLRGGKTKVLITSRSTEDWLGNTNRFRLPLGGLYGEERWRFCEVILDDLGLHVDRTDAGLVDLMNRLDGHPLLMRVVLPLLEARSAADLARALDTNLAALGLADDTLENKLFATLRFVETTLPDDLRPLLVPLGLHERFVDADYLEAMAKQVADGPTRAQIDRLMHALTTAGLFQEVGQAIYRVHPMLTSFLRSSASEAVPEEQVQSWTTAFVGVMSALANHLAPKPLHEQRVPFFLHEASFHRARDEAERLEMLGAYAALTQVLAFFAQNTRNFEGAASLFNQLADVNATRGWEEGVAGAYHQLGIVAQKGRAFDEAERWYRKAVEIKERLGDELDAAATYFQLGRIAEERRAFDEAERWYRKSVEIKERLDDEHGAASTYGQLGLLSEAQGNIIEAGQWMIQCLLVFIRMNDAHYAQVTVSNYRLMLSRATPEEQTQLRQQWEEAGLPPLLDDGNP